MTIADRGAEEMLRARIERRFPDHAILGEEFGLTGSAGASCRWILDPVDGTQSFVHGVPLFATLDRRRGRRRRAGRRRLLPGPRRDGARGARAGRAVERPPLPGVDHLVARRGDVLLHRGRRLHAQRPRRTALDRLLGATRTHRGWGDAYAHALVATGRVDLAVEPIMNIWDNAPLLPILAEAGGAFTDWTGTSRIDGGDAVSTNGVLHEAVLSLLRAG